MDTRVDLGPEERLGWLRYERWPWSWREDLEKESAGIAGGLVTGAEGKRGIKRSQDFQNLLLSVYVGGGVITKRWFRGG